MIDDDGPGIEPGRRESVMARGTRLDESVPGSGLGLAIVHELVGLYGGSVRLQAAPTGGLRVESAAGHLNDRLSDSPARTGRFSERAGER